MHINQVDAVDVREYFTVCIFFLELALKVVVLQMAVHRYFWVFLRP
jgi:hypothetical protein